MKLTENFTLEEMCASQTAQRAGIDNSRPPLDVVINLAKLAVMVLQPLREHFGEPVRISSGYRCKALNEAVGGVSNSQHVTGQAADIYLLNDTKREQEYFSYIVKNLPYDQLILEGNQSSSWIHVSFNSLTKNRKLTWMHLKKTSGAL